MNVINEHRANIVQALISRAHEKFPNKEKIPEEEAKDTKDPQMKKKKRDRPKKSNKVKLEQISKNNSDTQKFKELFAPIEEAILVPEETKPAKSKSVDADKKNKTFCHKSHLG